MSRDRGTNSNYGKTTAATNLGSGSSAVSISQALSSLLPERTYHYRAAASNTLGLSLGADKTFTTPLPHPVLKCSVPNLSKKGDPPS